MTLANYVREKVAQTGMALRALAEEAGVSHGTLHNIISSVSETPDVRILVSLARYFGGDPQERKEIYTDLMRLAGYFDLYDEGEIEALLGAIQGEGLRRVAEGRIAYEENEDAPSGGVTKRIPSRAEMDEANLDNLLEEAERRIAERRRSAPSEGPEEPRRNG